MTVDDAQRDALNKACDELTALFKETADLLEALDLGVTGEVAINRRYVLGWGKVRVVGLDLYVLATGKGSEERKSIEHVARELRVLAVGKLPALLTRLRAQAAVMLDDVAIAAENLRAFNAGLKKSVAAEP